MLASTRLRASLAALAAAVLLTACGVVPPLHRSVVVQTDNSGMPVHASGAIAHDRYTVVRGDTLYSIAFRANVDYHQLARWNGIGAPYVIHPGQVLRLSRPAAMRAEQPQVPVFQTVTQAPKAPPRPVPTPTAPARPTTSAASPAQAPAQSSAQSPAVSPAAAESTVVAVAGQPPVSTSPPVTVTAPPIPAGATRNAAGIAWRWPASGAVLNAFNPNDAQPGIIIAGNAGDPVRAAAAGVVVYSGNGLVGYGELVIIKHNDDYLSAYGHNSKRLVSEGEHVRAGQIIARMGSTGAPRDELEFQVRYKGKPVNPLDYLPKR